MLNFGDINRILTNKCVIFLNRPKQEFPGTDKSMNLIHHSHSPAAKNAKHKLGIFSSDHVPSNLLCFTINVAVIF